MSEEAQTSKEVLESYGISFESDTLPLNELTKLNRQSGLLVKYLLDFQNTLTREDNASNAIRLDKAN